MSTSPEDLDDLRDLRESPDDVPRFVILDGPNIMHYGKSNDHSKVSLSRLLVVMRYLVAQDFEVAAVMPWRYGVKCSETNKRAINKLEEMGMACLTDAHIHDDIAMLEMALTTDGVVVSNDKFRDHMKFSPRFKKVIDRSVSVKISEIEITNLDKCVSFFQQRTAPRGFPSLTLHDSFFSTLDNIRHVIVKGTRRYWTEKYRDKTLKTIDELFKRVWEEESELFKNRVKTG